MTRLHKKNIFLVDGLGAMTTALLLFLLLGRFPYFFGVPSHISYWLSGIAVLFALYSFVCHFLVSFTRRLHFGSALLLIAVLNTLYCVLTTYLIFQLPGISIWGTLYFTGEVLLILCLVFVEVGLARRA